MNIEKIAVWKENLKLTRPYSIAYETVNSVENLFVFLEAENGQYGIGAGSPAIGVTGENIQDCERALKKELEPILLNADIRFFQSLIQRLAKATASTPAARAAVDIALHDLISKVIGLPLAEVLGRVHKTMQTSITIGIKTTPKETLIEAKEYWDRGFKVMKVKAGQYLEKDIEALILLREKFGPELVIRVDANQGYSVADYRKFLKQTKGINLEFVEQPLPASSLENMRSLDKSIRLISVGDESILTPEDTIECLCPPLPFGIFNIKLMKCGGISPALEIARMARLKNINLMWGCMDESIVSISAALHAAFASPATRYLDLDGSLDLARDLVEGGFVLDKGWMRLTDRPGLGVSRI